MLGDKIGEETGRVTGQRTLPGPKMETTFQVSGNILGVSHRTTGTYTSHMRPDGTLFGEGQGIVMSAEGGATWVGQGIGKIGKDGAVSYRGAIYYSSAVAKWARLNSVAALFEYEVDAQGNTKAQIWEWK